MLLNKVQVNRIPVRFECEYRCGFCGFVFKQIVREGKDGAGERVVSDKVECPHCNNFLKTWS